MDWTFVRLLMALLLHWTVQQCHSYTTSSPGKWVDIPQLPFIHSFFFFFFLNLDWRKGLVALAQTRANEEEDPRCRNFTIGLPHRQEFYSPGYPGSYPPKIDCILILEGLDY